MTFIKNNKNKNSSAKIISTENIPLTPFSEYNSDGSTKSFDEKIIIDANTVSYFSSVNFSSTLALISSLILSSFIASSVFTVNYSPLSFA